MSRAASVSMSARAGSRRLGPLAVGKGGLIATLGSLLPALALVGSLWALAFAQEGAVYPEHLILGVIVFALSFPSRARLSSSFAVTVLDVALNWLWIAGLLALTGYVTGYLHGYSSELLTTWLWVAPLSDLTARLALRAAAPALARLQGPRQRGLIVGMNEQGINLAERMRKEHFSDVELAGFVDSRSALRSGRAPAGAPWLGDLDDLAALVQRHRIQQIYLSMPMASQPRILKLLDDLKDTTASIHFVPDLLVTDLIQGHPAMVCDTLVISVCDTPFRGINGLIKRGSDIVFSLLILILIAPLLLGIAVAVKASSPGPVIFRQRRYGLEGEEIIVYKFRSMRVAEDGDVITQARRGDARVTPLGAVLRRTSLDELPQFVNVLQGRMSIVGPRPHAVAHNETYRKLIKGYMVRHKVRPGITGWAQVNGFRGETETLDKMAGRIEYDLDYLRNWSLKLDILIILKTIRLVLRDQKAY